MLGPSSACPTARRPPRRTARARGYPGAPARLLPDLRRDRRGYRRARDRRARRDEARRAHAEAANPEGRYTGCLCLTATAPASSSGRSHVGTGVAAGTPWLVVDEDGRRILSASENAVGFLDAPPRGPYPIPPPATTHDRALELANERRAAMIAFGFCRTQPPESLVRGEPRASRTRDPRSVRCGP